MSNLLQVYNEKVEKKRVFFTGSDALADGYAVCYDRNMGTAADSEKHRTVDVEQPAAGNLHNFAGIVYGTFRATTGGQWISILQPANAVMHPHTDQNCTQETTKLCVQAGSYALGALGAGPVVATALQTVDRSSTSGTVQAAMRPVDSIKLGSAALWEGCPWREAQDDPQIGYGYFNDFLFWDDTDDFVKTAATAGTAAIVAGAGGLLELDAASATADQGIQVQHTIGNILPAAGKDIWFEVSLSIADTPDKAQFFAGLALKDTTLFATGENSTADHIGFEMGATIQAGGSAGKAQFYAEKGGTRGTVADLHTFVDALVPNVKLGFLVRGVTSVTPYVDGVAQTALLTANIPVAALVLSLACQSEGTNDPIAMVDWVRAFQLR